MLDFFYADINECHIPGALCFEPGTLSLKESIAECANLQGDYACLCKDGYRHESFNNKKLVLNVDHAYIKQQCIGISNI